MRLFFFLWLSCCLCLETSWANTPAPLDSIKNTMQAGHYATAIEALRVVLEKEPDHYQAWFLFGVSQALEQQYNQAIEAFRHVVVLRPDLAEPHNNLAGVYNALGDPKMAIHELEIALAKQPNYAIAEENIANLHIDLALKHYRNSLEQASNLGVEQRFARLLQVRNPALDRNSSANISDALQQNSQQPLKQDKQPASKQQAAQTTMKKTLPATATTTTVSHEAPQHFITAVLDALEAWRVAWSAQDVPAYFATYSADYQPASRFSSYQAWRAYKRRVIQDKKFIQVDFEHVEVTIKGNVATVTMLQRFRSDSYNGNERKKIIFQYANQRWQIVAEAAI